jgi:hypothetical protein
MPIATTAAEAETPFGHGEGPVKARVVANSFGMALSTFAITSSPSCAAAQGFARVGR